MWRSAKSVADFFPAGRVNAGRKIPIAVERWNHNTIILLCSTKIKGPMLKEEPEGDISVSSRKGRDELA